MPPSRIVGPLHVSCFHSCTANPCWLCDILCFHSCTAKPCWLWDILHWTPLQAVAASESRHTVRWMRCRTSFKHQRRVHEKAAAAARCLHKALQHCCELQVCWLPGFEAAVSCKCAGWRCWRPHVTPGASPRAAGSHCRATAGSKTSGDSAAKLPATPRWAWNRLSQEQDGGTSKEPARNNSNATPVALHCIELIHWASFPLGFVVAYFIFAHAQAVAAGLKAASGSSANLPVRVLFAVLGVLCHVFGGRVAGSMLQLHEGWQGAACDASLSLPADPAPQQANLSRIQATHRHAWLRCVESQLLFTFQSLGLLLFATAVYGVNARFLVLLVGALAVALLGPSETRTDIARTTGSDAAGTGPRQRPCHCLPSLE
jgi:hypothetical protein